MSITAAQSGSTRQLQQWKDGRRKFLDGQGKKTPTKGRID
jgi:hypothetical protein